MIESLKWLSDHNGLVQAMAAIAQAIIAGLMLWTLFQNRKLLNLTNRQLESMVEPILTPRMFGTTIRLTNDSSVLTKGICKTAVLGGWLDGTSRKLSGYQVVRMDQPIREVLAPGQFLDIDITRHAIPVPGHEDSNLGAGMRVFAIVLTYKRAADMKSFRCFLPFTAENLPPRSEQGINFAMPLFPSAGSCEAGPAGKSYSNWMGDAKEELLRLYREKVAQTEVM